MIAPQPAPLRKPSSAPALTPTSTPREASAFMTTIDQSPSSTSQVSVWRPEPSADASQNRWLAGASGLPSPSSRR